MEEPLLNSRSTKNIRGGWRTFPYIAGGLLGTGIATSGVMYNLVVYLIKQYNIGSITATQTYNVVSGCLCLAPLVGAIVSDSGLGAFAVISVSSTISLLGVIILTLTASVPSLRPHQCTQAGNCEAPTSSQLILLYTALALLAIGVGGTRFTTTTLGANQFDDNGDRAIFFNWYFVLLYVSFILGQTCIVYLQDNLGWTFGFGVCTAFAIFSVLAYTGGGRFYCLPEPQQNAFVGLWHRLASSLKKQSVPSSFDSREFDGGDSKPSIEITTENTREMKDAEDYKAVIRLLPLISTSLIVYASAVLQSSLTILQAMVMDCHIGRFVIPAGSITIFVIVAAAICISLLDCLIYPTWQKLHEKPPTALQRVGAGYFLVVGAFMMSALVEFRRLMLHQNGSVESMSALWLAPPLLLTGLSEAFFFPGCVAFYYQEFPVSLRGTSTSIPALTSGLGSYIGVGLLGLVQKLTNWLNDDINRSRLDKIYWLLAAICAVNFAYFLVCVRFYMRQRA